MKEAQFTAQRQPEWDAWDHWIENISKKPRGKPSNSLNQRTISTPDLPQAYRQLCQDLSIAQDRCYSTALIDGLQQRVLQVHQHIYSARPKASTNIIQFFANSLPQLVRREFKLVAFAALCLLLPLIATTLLLQIYPEGGSYLLSAEQMAQFEEMYAPGTTHVGRLSSDADARQVSMIAFYISHNIRIDFQCFAGGIAFGLGSLFYLIFNGLHIGATAGHLTQLGYYETFWGFVAGHSAPELIGAILSGAAGLKIGSALISPGLHRRAYAVKEAAWQAAPMLFGAACLTFAAAFIEALWSPNNYVSFEFKIGFGVTQWIVLVAYFAFFGKHHAD